ncbi:YeeE/YedE thiosulfate transporter family protein [Novosphingobium sp.]|uniref:YeeE/YedE thiosulfate transporter family protein n=1 Tax=Novosphingobium sp. TaxID=1874826 RepID=UPI003BAD6FB6
MTGGLADPAHPVILVVALLCAAVMGFSIQHGGTCMVAAVGQVLSERRLGRLLALLECSLWVAALGVAVRAAGLRFAASPEYPASLGVVFGGALLGLGAWLNEACVFGAIARIGKGDLHFLLTPPGFFLGSLLHARFAGAFAAPSMAAPISLPVALALSLLFAASLAASGRQILAVRRAETPIAGVWDYRHATIAIGITFVVLCVAAGPWTYTEALGRAAHSGALPGSSTILLLFALIGGAIAGGWRTAAFAPFSVRRSLTCLAGGALMGLGGALVPGGNDNLILAGLPGLQPHAWLAIAMMVVGIATGLLAGPRLRRLRLAGPILRKNQA